MAIDVTGKIRSASILVPKLVAQTKRCTRHPSTAPSAKNENINF